MNIEEAKNIIDHQFERAIHSDIVLDNFHPIRLIQALKSLIGIDIDNPSKKLIEWGEDYLSNIEPLPKRYFFYSIKKTKETIVMSDLGDHILSKEYNFCVEELQGLCSVSDGGQIFEYLLEFASINNVSAIPFIWSAFRSNIFLKNKYSYHLLLLSVKFLIENESIGNGLISNIEESCIIESIKSGSLTRQSSINSQLEILILNKHLIEEDVGSIIDVEKKGRSAILEYLNGLELKSITLEMILFLDACRMMLKDSSSNNRQNIPRILNQVIERKLYVKKNW